MDIIIIVAVHAQRFGVGVLSWGKMTMILGVLPSLKDREISLNLGSWLVSSPSVHLGAPIPRQKPFVSWEQQGQRWLLTPLLMG